MQTRNPDAGLRARLNALLKRHTRAEIARKTGTSLANVSRYANATRMPASFCASLVTQLGVNPAWLLAGEGTALTADITGGTQRMAGNILELVEAMNSVTRMRLGSLTGRHHVRVLRDLNEALSRYEHLRVRLNAHSRAIFASMVADLTAALVKKDLERAVELRKSAQQVARLCDDEALQREFARLCGHIEYLLRNTAKSMEYQRQVFMQTVLARRELSESDFEELMRYALSLQQLNFHGEALRVVEIALRLLPQGAAFDLVPWMHVMRGQLQLDLGDLRAGTATLLEHYPRLSGNRRAAAEASLVHAFLLSGAFGVEQGIAFGAHIDTKAYYLLRHAQFTEDKAALAMALAYFDQPRVAKIARASNDPDFMRVLHGALCGRRAREAEIRRSLAGMPAKPAIVRAGAYSDFAQLARLSRHEALARELHAQAQRALDELAPGTACDWWGLGVHWRNALALNFDTSRALEFFRARAQAGFGAFARLASLP